MLADYNVYKISNLVTIKNQKVITSQLKQLNKIQLRQGVKQLHFCQKQNICVLLTSDCVLIVDTQFGEVVKQIKKLAYPRYVRLANNGKFIVVYYSTNTVSIMDLNGKEISNVLGVPISSNVFLISENCRKLLYGNNQTICMWNIQNASIQVLTKQWKNINCYAISYDGKQFALGTYGGSIIVLTIIGDQKVTQFQINRHKSCIMALTFHKNNIVSVSYDKLYIQTIIQTNQNKQKLLSYVQYSLNQVPRQLVSCGQKVYLSYMNGLFWFNKNGKLLGFDQGTWNVFENEQKQVIFVKCDKAKVQWWKFQQTITYR